MAQSKEDRERARKRSVQQALRLIRELTANLLRVAGRAGLPGALPGQIVNSAIAIVEHEKRFGWGDLNVAEAVCGPLPTREDVFSKKGNRRDREQDAINLIMRASFRLAASELLDQSRQIINAEALLFQGLEDWMKIGGRP